ncbi:MULTISPECIES: SDR family oxidoreductase [unclassified Mycolicibacterium]|uniref:SDR family oxidoreductase n=1 Tax=unclassified Mycolicibacterium TaxID=2636767 RepID=UPI001F4C1E7F|nr:SDR family oxidoreductase [Mycolicibacterium sp. YH-1]UNB52734.1 SDR family oxidoreductase [Mycolicibacterium sp. YH-1]
MILENKTIVVTGVGDGLGRECATSALRQGARVVLAARSHDKLKSIAAELDPDGQRVAVVPTDITDPASCEELADAAASRFGEVHGLVQVAAFENAWGGLHDMKPDDWRKAHDTNVLGAYNVVRALHRHLKAAGGGSVVFIGSQSMFKPSLSQAGYASTKGALLTATYYLADELGADNIRVNMVVPSWMWGPPVQMYVDYKAQTDGVSPEEVLDGIAGGFPLRRMAEDGEVADTVAFFLSDLSKAVTGQHLQVNAGELSR